MSHYLNPSLSREQLSSDDLRAIELAFTFDKLRQKYEGKYKLSLQQSNVKSSKNWKYFENFVKILAEFPNINPDLYIEAQFYYAKKLNRLCMPAWLTTPNSIKRYFNYIEELERAPITNEVSYTDQFIYSLKNTILFVYGKMKELKLKRIEDLLSYKDKGAMIPKSFMWVQNGSIGKPFLSVSRSFKHFLNTLDLDIKSSYPSLIELSTFKEKIVLNSTLRKLCKDIIQDEIDF